MNKENARATVPARVQLGAVKVHGPNSDQPEGTREEIATEGPRIIQVNYDQALEMWGPETAELLFKGVPEEDR
jgi:hypothetical protein